MTNQETIQEVRKKKLSKSYGELLGELKDLFQKTAAVYVPELCVALAVEHTDWSNREIQDKIYLDLDGIWAKSTITESFPSWIHKPGKVAGGKKAWETRNARKLAETKKIFVSLEKVDLPPPPATSPAKDDDEEFEISEEMDAKLADMGMGRFGSQGKTLHGVLGDINLGLARAFKALTESKYMPTEDSDLIVDYIKPSREFRKSLAIELDDRRRTTLHNWLHYVTVVAEDMIEQIKAAEASK
jgi:hypothetical protein